MAMKIRCTECTKKISIDEAFAGGVCRCPYCSALVFVGGASDAMVGAGVRPSAPTSRPASPMERPAAPTVGAAPHDLEAHARAQGQEDIPTASPVKVQGIVTIVLLGLLLLMVAGVIVTAVTIFRGGGDVYVPPPLEQNPFAAVTSKRVVAGDIRVNLPVYYIVDGGGSMGETFFFALEMIQKSLGTLEEGDKFNVIICREDGDKVISAELLAAGEGSPAAVAAVMENLMPSGATDVGKTISATLAKKPGTIVLMAKKYIEDAEKIGQEVKGKDVVFVTICLDGLDDAAAAMAKMAAAADGQAKAFSLSELEAHSKQARQD